MAENLPEVATKPDSQSQNFEAPPPGPENGSKTPNGYMELKPSPDSSPPKKKRRKWKYLVFGLLVAALCLCGLLFGYYLRGRKYDEEQELAPTREPCYQQFQQKWSLPDPRHLELLHENLMYSTNGDRMVSLLSNFTLLSVYSTSISDQILVHVIQKFFEKVGLEDDSLKKYNSQYDSLLSFPNRTNPNLVMVLEIGYTSYTVHYLEPSEAELRGLEALAKNMTGPDGKMMEIDLSEYMEEHEEKAKVEEDWPPPGVMPSPEQIRKMKEAQENPDFGFDAKLLALEAHLPFVAYSPEGVAMGELMYVNNGFREDFEVAKAKRVPIEDKIALFRMGKGTLREKVRVAEEYGIKGVLLYWDPADLPPGTPCTNKAPYANLNDENLGDPLTPGYAATEGMLRGTIEEANFPTIPVQTVSCQFAYYMLRNISGEKAPPEWNGGFNITYVIGRRPYSALTRWTIGWFVDQGKNNWTVRMEVHNQFERKNITNVIGRLQGHVDPDSYVIIGASRNSLAKGNNTGVIGTSMLLEFTRNLGVLIHQENWRPKRTIIICSWGGSDFGNVGIIEFLQEYKEVLSGRVVSYINLDNPVIGGHILSATSSPALEDIIYNVAQRVPSPDDQQYMLFDTWKERTDHNVSSERPTVVGPYESLQMGQSDPFYTMLSTPTVHMQYLPAPHSENATEVDEDIMVTDSQHHFRHHTAVGRMAGLLALSLADATVIQFEPIVAAQKLEKDLVGVINNIELISPQTAAKMRKSSHDLVEASADLYKFIMEEADFEVDAMRRTLNTRLITCENLIAKVVTQMFRLRSYFDGLSIAAYEGSPERAINTTVADTPQTVAASFLQKEISILLHALQMATQSLQIELQV